MNTVSSAEPHSALKVMLAIPVSCFALVNFFWAALKASSQIQTVIWCCKTPSLLVRVFAMCGTVAIILATVNN